MAGNKKRQVRKEKLHTDSLSPNLAVMARAIQPTEGHMFRTRVSGLATEQNTRWREAIAIPGTKLWNVIQCMTSLELSGFMEKRSPILEEVSFFDALYSLALFETQEKPTFKRTVVRGTTESEKRHYKFFAEEQAGIPFDEAGLPHVAFDGVIHTNGNFPTGAHRIAEQSPPLQKVDFSQPVIKTRSNLPVLFQDNALIESPDNIDNYIETIKSKTDGALQIKNHAKPFEKSVKAVENLKDAFEYADKHHYGPIARKKWFKDWYDQEGSFPSTAVFGAIGGFAVGLVSAGIGWAVIGTFFGKALVGGGAFYGGTLSLPATLLFGFESPRRAPKKALKKLDRKIKALPEGSYKEDLQKFRNYAALGYYMINARQALKAVKKGSRLEKWRVSRSLKALFNETQKQGLDEHVFDAMKKEVESNLRSDRFDSKILRAISQKHEDCENAVEQLKEKMTKALPGPVL